MERSDGGLPLAFTLQGLTIGERYSVQIAVADNRGFGDKTQTVTSGGATSGTMTFGSSSGPGFATIVEGLFTADATTQIFAVYGDPENLTPQINQVIVQVVPEPSVSALGGVVGAGVVIAGIRRRRHRGVSSGLQAAG